MLTDAINPAVMRRVLNYDGEKLGVRVEPFARERERIKPTRDGVAFVECGSYDADVGHQLATPVRLSVGWPPQAFKTTVPTSRGSSADSG
jgi:hypothetical protein